MSVSEIHHCRPWCRRSLAAGIFVIVAGGYGQLRAQHLDGGVVSAGPPAGAPSKPIIDAMTPHRWFGAENAMLSPDGRYATYVLSRLPEESHTLVVTALDARVSLKRCVYLSAARPVGITTDSRRLLFTKAGDTLGILPLGDSVAQYVANAREIQLPRNGAGGWLAYRSTTPAHSVILRNLATGIVVAFDSVRTFTFNPTGTALVIETSSPTDSTLPHTLTWIRLADGRRTLVWRGTSPLQIAMDRDGTQVAFMVKDSKGENAGTSLWYFHGDSGAATLLASDSSVRRMNSADTTWSIGSAGYFSANGRRLLFDLRGSSPAPPPATGVRVEIWSYTDTVLYPNQQAAMSDAPQGSSVTYAVAIDLRDHRLTRLWNRRDYVQESRGDFALVEPHSDQNANEWSWNRGVQHAIDVVSLQDGHRIRILGNTRRHIHARISSQGKYVVYYDPERRDYFSYTIATGVVHNLSGQTPIVRRSYLDGDDVIDADGSEPGRFPLGWTSGDSAVLLHDANDLWQFDPEGRRPPLNLTNGYGYAHHVAFTPVFRPDIDTSYSGTLLLQAVDLKTHDEGFYRVTVGETKEPVRLRMAPYHYELVRSAWSTAGKPSLVRRERAEEIPNFFVTTDWRTFVPLTDEHPERAYNWLTAELITWKLPDGRQTQGVLYKPENFDPTKRYPVLFLYYEKESYRLHLFQPLDISDGAEINIPSYVSRGYLVFAPDFQYKIGAAGESALQTVESAARLLATKPWVDRAHMGIMGHSFGGYQTNYIVTHSTMFAAALAGSGMSDVISNSGELRYGSTTNQGYYENGQGRIGASLWERPDLYIANSPVFRANRVTTPLLLMSNKRDGTVPFAQGVEMFTALRRLGKRVWLLQYDDGDHGVDGPSANDFTIRIAQFFDHYLKGAPAPKWMLQSIPASQKGIDTGLQLDTTGKTPGPGLLVTSH